jgi:hypothetical protein
MQVPCQEEKIESSFGVGQEQKVEPLIDANERQYKSARSGGFTNFRESRGWRKPLLQFGSISLFRGQKNLRKLDSSPVAD